jgi:acyl carrier protein
MDRGIIDSIGVFALVDFIEQQYSITVSDGEITPENLDSINRIVAFIISKKDLDTLTAA